VLEVLVKEIFFRVLPSSGWRPAWTADHGTF